MANAMALAMANAMALDTYARHAPLHSNPLSTYLAVAFGIVVLLQIQTYGYLQGLVLA